MSTGSLRDVCDEVFRCMLPLRKVCSSVRDAVRGLCMLSEVLNVFDSNLVKCL